MLESVHLNKYLEPTKARIKVPRVPELLIAKNSIGTVKDRSVASWSVASCYSSYNLACKTVTGLKVVGEVKKVGIFLSLK